MAKNKPLDKGKEEKGAYLVINNQIFPLNKEVTTIGRKLENDLVLQDFLVSRSHAEIRFEKGKYHIYDLDSTGGTFLNQKKVSKGLLYSGDIILLASVPVMFIDDSTKLTIPPEEKTRDLT
jgi:pSer/pThr/pTyr-binding forkhead associated (FHA) protein